MTISKTRYHRNRLLRDRIRKDEAERHPDESEQEPIDVDDAFQLPDYFSSPAEPLDEDEGRSPVVILWDEVA